MTQQLPLQPSVANYRFGTTLDGTPYIIDIYWNSRSSTWYMDLLGEDEVPIRNSMRLVLGTLIGGRSADARFPSGSFLVVDLSGADIDAGFNDMGVRIMVWYIPE